MSRFLSRIALACLTALASPAYGQNATMTFPNGSTNSGSAQTALQGSRTTTPMLYAANSAAGDAKVLQFVETGCSGSTYGVGGVTYSASGTGVVGIGGWEPTARAGASQTRGGVGR